MHLLATDDTVLLQWLCMSNASFNANHSRYKLEHLSVRFNEEYVKAARAQWEALELQHMAMINQLYNIAHRLKLMLTYVGPFGGYMSVRQSSVYYKYMRRSAGN